MTKDARRDLRASTHKQSNKQALGSDPAAVRGKLTYPTIRAAWVRMGAATVAVKAKAKRKLEVRRAVMGRLQKTRWIVQATIWLAWFNTGIATMT